MELNDIILLIILCVGAIFINWTTLRRDILRISRTPRKKRPHSSRSTTSKTYSRKLEEAA